MKELKLLQWQEEVKALVEHQRVVLVSGGRGFGATTLGAHLLLSESRKGNLSVSLTPDRALQNVVYERITDQTGDRFDYSISGNRSTIVPAESGLFPHMALIHLLTERDALKVLSLSYPRPPLVVVDSGNRISPRPLIDLIDRHMHLVVFATMRRTSYRSSYFDLWFKAAWEDAKNHADWATYASTDLSREDEIYLTPEQAARFDDLYGTDWRGYFPDQQVNPELEQKRDEDSDWRS